MQKLQDQEKYGYVVEDIKDEIFDMVKPASQYAITLQDLLNCGIGDIVVSILTDANAFYNYDQREQQLNQQQDSTEENNF